MSFYNRLDPATRDRLMASHLRVDLADLAEARAKNMGDAHRIFQQDWFTMAQACFANELDAVCDMVRWGASLDRLCHGNAGDQDTNPLSWAIYGVESNPHRPDTLATLDFLLDQGADPNFISNHSPRVVLSCPMHTASNVPVALERLLQRGGDANCQSAKGWHMLDQWLWHCFSSDKKTRPEHLRALDMLLAAGLDIQRSTFEGGSFLVDCWGSSGLRSAIPELITRGFDPHARGSGKGSRGASLVEHLGKKVRTGKGGALAQQILAELAAQSLEDATPPAVAAHAKPRL